MREPIFGFSFEPLAHYFLQKSVMSSLYENFNKYTTAINSKKRERGISLNNKEVVFRNTSILSPFGELRVEPIEPRQRLNAVTGKIIGLLDANKPNGDVVMGIIQNYLSQQGVTDFVSEVKPVVTRPAPDSIIKKLSKADAIVLSFADCGSCTTGLAMDQAVLEREGVPTVAVVTSFFAAHYARIAESMGTPHLPIVVVEHPLGDGATRETAQKKAEKIPRSILEALTFPANDLKEKYSARKWIKLRSEL